MKTSPKFLLLLSALALFFVLAFSGDAFAELAGFHVPAVLNVENTLALFTVAFVLLIFVAEYRPRLSPLSQCSDRNRKPGPSVLGVTVTRTNVYGVRQPRSVRPRIAA